MSLALDPAELRALATELRVLRADMLRAERVLPPASSLPRTDQASLRNLVHYLAFRQRDLRPLQERLAELGLSSLGRAEAHVLASLDAVLTVLDALTGEHEARVPSAGAPSYVEGTHLLALRADALLGPAPAGRAVRIMVTLDEEASLRDVTELVEQGASLFRINCAHGAAGDWERLVGLVAKARELSGKPCRVSMDLGGPKLRTSAAAAPLRLAPGDRVRLVRDGAWDAARDAAPNETPSPPGSSPAAIPTLVCSLPDIFASVRPGERVFFDDGKVGAIVEEVLADGLVVHVERAREDGTKLKPDAGINFPDSKLGLEPLTAKDRKDLRFAAKHADIVALSFVESPAHVSDVAAELEAEGASQKPLLLKIETRRAFEALPDLLLASLGRRPLGVMIARGDLAVEVGYERLAEVQEEMLWICEAAHTPIVWATQVLERLAKKGQPTRAEITDAAMGERAECVMLNKGPHLAEAVHVLDDILRRMEAHQGKKSARLRALSVAHRLVLRATEGALDSAPPER